VAPATLVNFDIENGESVIKALDNANRAPTVALWAKLPDYENWRLVLASDRVNQDSPFSGYSEIIEAIRGADIPVQRRPAILLSPMKSPMVEALRSTFGKAKDTYGMRLGGQTFGDKYIEDAFVYRIR
jgi:hypothetical protein